MLPAAKTANETENNEGYFCYFQWDDCLGRTAYIHTANPCDWQGVKSYDDRYWRCVKW